MQDYFYLDSHNQQRGPVSPARFAELGVTPQTLVWCTGMADWAPAGSVAELSMFFRPGFSDQRPPEPPRQQTPPGNKPGPNPYANNGGPRCPDNHLVAAILVTIFCCLPCGVVALVKANQVNSFYYKGYYDQALLASADADKWIKYALIFGLISFCAYGGMALLL